MRLTNLSKHINEDRFQVIQAATEIQVGISELNAWINYLRQQETANRSPGPFAIKKLTETSERLSRALELLRKTNV